jgi:hypothetical protein
MRGTTATKTKHMQKLLDELHPIKFRGIIQLIAALLLAASAQLPATAAFEAILLAGVAYIHVAT